MVHVLVVVLAAPPTPAVANPISHVVPGRLIAVDKRATLVCLFVRWLVCLFVPTRSHLFMRFRPDLHTYPGVFL